MRMNAMSANDSGYLLSAASLLSDSGPKHSTPIKGEGIMRMTPGSVQALSGSVSQTTDSQQSLSFDEFSAYLPPPDLWLSECEADNDIGSVDAQHNKHVLTHSESVSRKMGTVDFENSTVVKQRQEIQLLVRELQDRDRELNDMVTSHQHQLSLWEQDRQLILYLQEKCAFLKEQVHEGKRELAAVMSKLQDVQKKAESSLSAQLQRSLSNCKRTLSDSVREVSIAKGHLDAGEQELNTLLQLKDSKLEEAASHIKVLKARIKQMELENEDSGKNSVTGVQWQQQYETVKEQNDQLKLMYQGKENVLQQLSAEWNEMRKQVLVLQHALDTSNDHIRCQDEIICSLRAQQERTKKEQIYLQNLYKRQNREMALLQLSLDSSRESCQEIGLQEHSTCANHAFFDAALPGRGSDICSHGVGNMSLDTRWSSSRDENTRHPPESDQELVNSIHSYAGYPENLHTFSNDFKRKNNVEEPAVDVGLSHPPSKDLLNLFEEKRAKALGGSFQLPLALLSNKLQDKTHNASNSKQISDTSYEENELLEPRTDSLECQFTGKTVTFDKGKEEVRCTQSSQDHVQACHGKDRFEKPWNYIRDSLQDSELGDKSTSHFDCVCGVQAVDNAKICQYHMQQSSTDRVSKCHSRLYQVNFNSPTQNDSKVRKHSDDKKFAGICDTTDCQHPSLKSSRCHVTESFDEKLASYLSSPGEELGSTHPRSTQGDASPASKLHRLLLESQEMIKALEKTSVPVFD